MTVITEAEKPALTYSKARGLVGLVSGTHRVWILSTSFLFFIFEVSNFFAFLFVSQLLWNKEGWVWMTSFRGSPQTPTPASSEYHLTHVFVLFSQEDKALGKHKFVCPVGHTLCLNVTPTSADSDRKQMMCSFSYLFGCNLNWPFCYLPVFSPEVQSILNLSPPQDAELMNANPSPPVCAFSVNNALLTRWYMQHMLPGHTFSISLPFLHVLRSSQSSPSQQINLGPSSNPSAKPSDFHFLKVIGKGSFGKVLLARHRSDDQFYAVKVLQKKAILKKKEVKKLFSKLGETCTKFHAGSVDV